jgi:tryptophan synthase beta chain
VSQQVKFTLGADEYPHTWYNIVADLPGGAAPALNPATGEPLTPDQMAATMPAELIEQELSTEREFEIPGAVRELYARWRPTPLFRARALEKALETPARLYYKYEGTSPTGSHKPNTALAQAYYHKLAGKRGLVTETGAGQWGTAISMAAQLFGMDALVFMVKVSYQQKPYRRAFMQTYGARCVASPSIETAAGRAVLAEDPDSPGSLGIATSEALAAAAADPTLGYTVGSALNHVLAHQTVIGQEAIAQMALADDYPDVVVGCAGGGSNLAGLAFPFIGVGLRGGRKARVVAVEPAACPTLTRGRIAYDFADIGRLSPLVRMHTLGHTFVPPGFHAGGLRAHGIGPLITRCLEENVMEAIAVAQTDCFAAGVQFARTEGILPAPESTHAVLGAVQEALRCREEGVSRSILFGLSGHGHFDLAAYQQYFAGELTDESLSDEVLERSLAALPELVNV